MSRESKEQRAPKVSRRVTVFSFYEDTVPGKPRTWAVVKGTADLADIQVEQTISESDPLMTRAFLAREVDRLELLK